MGLGDILSGFLGGITSSKSNAPSPSFQWKPMQRKLSDDLGNWDGTQLITETFYVSGYACPVCSSTMFKTIFHNGYTINVPEGKISIPRVFTCRKCRSFYASKPGENLSSGNGYMLEFMSEQNYKNLLTKMTQYGSTQPNQG